MFLGDIIYVRLFDTDIIVLNSASIAMELLDKRSRIYSDRPFYTTVEPCVSYSLDRELFTDPPLDTGTIATLLLCDTVNIGDCAGEYSSRHSVRTPPSDFAQCSSEEPES